MIKDEKKESSLPRTISEFMKAGRPQLGRQARRTREFFFLPSSRSPEINSDEYADRTLRAGIRSRAPEKIEGLPKRARRIMSRMAGSV